MMTGGDETNMSARVFCLTFWITLLPLTVALVAHQYRTKSHDSRVSYYTLTQTTGLYPRIFNLAKHANISVNGTCGSTRPEVYCRRPTDKEARKANQCVPTLCDPKRNNIRKATDGSKDSWISPTLENGLEYEYITITLDLKQVYQVVYVTMKAGIAPLPVAWVLERSLDGITYSPWQYFAESDSECRRRYGMAATQAKPHFKTDDELICLINYPKYYRMDHDEVHVSLLNGRPSSNFSSDALGNFTLARYVRFRLQKMYKTEKDLVLRKKLYYSIKTIIIGGQCMCYGHASKCIPNKITGLPTCECEHNTCGKHCNECCPMYNQVPWSPGTSESAGECEKCECHGHADACIYKAEVEEAKLSLDTNGFYRGGGKCLNCKNHTTGVNCEKCEKGWYRPEGVLSDNFSPCQPCDCHPIGSTGDCVQNIESHPDKLPGSCECNIGYAGEKCDKCALGWRNFPNCEPCPCDSRGSIITELCDVPCSCKVNVEGEFCDRCRPGYFGLTHDNPEGCTKCYCSGLSATCKEANITYDVIEAPLEGWLITDLSTSRTIVPTEDPDSGTLYIGNYELPGIESYYWLAPSFLRGSQVNLYGGMSLTFTVGWEAMRGDTSGQPTVGPNIILVGNNGIRLGFGEDTFKGSKGNATLRAVLIEDAWYVIPSHIKDIRTRLRRTEYRGATITREQFLAVLGNVTLIMLRAKFHTDQVEGSLFSVKLEPLNIADNKKFYLVEKCDCPHQYRGLSCESCAFSHYRATNTTFNDDIECLPCPCNQHSDCDPDTQICKKCEHNTQGEECDLCKDGYYGNATDGTWDACKPCACPLVQASNNFSPKCELVEDEDAIDSREYVCTECPIGYAGNHCETCDEFYYGNPSLIGGTCLPCDCNGGLCDNVTGECLECLGNTEGILCEKCKPLHYRTSNSTACIRCDCYAQGSEDESCDADTGQCKCKAEYTGRRCNHCTEGFGLVDGVCEKCNCGIGASSKNCDPLSKECECREGVFTPQCDTCEPFYYGISAEGCKGCNCHTLGSDHLHCDNITGQCPCKSNVTGRVCDQCSPTHWGISSGQGCRPCDCNPVGSLSPSCDTESGQCMCKQGVGGLKCNLCLPNHYGFSTNGCYKCQECKLLGHVCDPETGRCVCPPYTQGVHCQTCTPYAWGYQILKGCTPCNCDSGGSVKSQCDFNTGECTCREGFRGTRCNQCDHGFYNFPFCKACNCNFAGTQNDTCDLHSERCQCDDDGACQCKSNVIGEKCDQCKNGTFGIQADNPNGCTTCFCFGRSASCTQAGLHWSQIRGGRPRSIMIEYDPSASFKNTLPIDSQEICYINLIVPGEREVTINGVDRGLNVTNNLRTLPGDSEDVKIGVSFLIDTPVYWKLPNQFLGDKVLSYGGYLKFFVKTEGGNTPFPPTVLSTYPLVQLQGNNKIVLQHFPLLPNKLGYYEVRFQESLWEDKYHPDRKVSRETFMIALQNIQHILIRASDSADFNKAVLKDVSLDTAAASTGLALAGGVELCECPPKYNSTSCQDPSIGFYRWYDKDVNTATILIQLIGEARPCECNNRTNTCHIETGFCQNCAGNTGGPHCERCGEGFYGDPFSGPCLSCPCPTPDRNFAISCLVYDGKDPICNCKQGYTGKFCERCAYGWFGYPDKKGGFCQPCKCNIHGSVSDECDENTGQCNCRLGIEGRDCSVCPKKTVLTANGCSTCEDECSGTLLKDFEKLTKNLENRVKMDLSSLGPPWKTLQELSTKLTIVQSELGQWKDFSENISEIIEKNVPHVLNGKAKTLVLEAHSIESRAKIAKNDASFVRKETDYLLDKILELKEGIQKTIQSLKTYSESRKNIVSDSTAIMEATWLLREIMKNNLHPQKQRAEVILDYCTGILNKTIHMNERYPEIWEMKDYLKNLYGKLEDLEKVIMRTIELLQKRLYHIEINEDNIKHLKNKLSQIDKNLDEVEEIQIGADNLLYDADSYLTSVEENVKNLTNLEPRLKNATEELEKKEGILQNLNPLYRNKYVKPAQMHAEHLIQKAKDYKELLNATIQDTSLALDASKSYQDIIDDLEAAKKAAKDAIESDLMYTIFPSEFDESILKRSDVMKLLSTRLKNTSSSQGKENIDLRNRLNREKEKVNLVENTIREVGIRDNKISGELDILENNGVKDNIRVALDNVSSVEEKLNEATEKLRALKSDVSNKLKVDMLNMSEKDGVYNVNKAQDEILKTLHINRRMTELLNNMTDRSSKGNPSMPQIPDVLTQLKNKIMEARHAAQSIQLSLTSISARGCVRSFKVFGLEPTTTNRLLITITVDPLSANRIIFFLPSSTTSDFMAVELIDGSIRFLWNNGGGTGIISKSLLENSKKTGPRWYKVLIERMSYTAKLWVYTEDLTDVSPVSNSSNPNFSRMDVNSNDRIWVGGLPQDYDRPTEILSLQQGLPGCLHSLLLDDRPIGLWNHYTDSTDSCSACEKGIDAVADGSSYSFNGNGYAVLKHAPKTIYNKYQFSVALKFKTYDDNSILFLAISADKTRYASLTLREGRIVFQIGYGEETQLEMSSTKKYNDGNWTSVEASRNFDRRRIIEKGLLKVEDEMKEAAPPTPPMLSQIPELNTADYLIGGYPPGYNFGYLNLRLPKPFLGCLADVFIEKDIYNPLKGKTNGVGISCADKVLKAAGFHGKGYMKLEAVRLKKDSSFGLALRTLQSNALILLANGVTQKLFDVKDFENEIPKDLETRLPNEERKRESYYSVSLVEGSIEVRINAGNGVIILLSQILCNDGRFHSISVIKTGRKLELRVDDELQSSSSLPGGAVVVKAKDLYLGGVPDTMDASIYASDTTPFIGTIKDLFFNFGLQSFDKPIFFDGVDIGRVGPEKVDNMTYAATTKSPPHIHFQCRRSRKYALDPRAAKLGDSVNSFIQINLRRRGIFQKGYSIELNFRTFNPNGLLFLIPGTNKSGKQKNFLLTAITSGQLQVIVKAKRKLEIMSEFKLNNGSWHNIFLSREERKLNIFINKAERLRLKLPKKVNLGNSVYIGGIADYRTAEPLIHKIPGFTGCVKNLKINNQTEDLIGEKSIHQGVGQCFPQIEKGSYFSGDAYVAYRKDFTIETLFKIELEFRTSELSGILLSYSDFLGQPALSLEINNGKVIFLGDFDNKVKFRLVHEFVSEFIVCDNKWHRIHIMLEDYQIIMRVDQSDIKHKLEKGEFWNFIISSPIYIGGLPEHIPDGRPILETRDNFKGCMRNIVVGDQNVDFTEINMRHNILIGSCPANNNH